MIRSQKGFSLTEVVIALGVFGLIGASIMGALNASSRTIVSTQEVTIAESLTRTIIEHIKRSPYDSQAVTTNLAASIAETTDTIPVDDADDFPESGIVQIEDELIQYADKIGDSLSGCVRGFAGTVAASHDIGIAVADTPVYDVVNDVGIDLTGDPYYDDYPVEVGVFLLDADADDSDDYKDDDGIQRITVKVSYHDRPVLTTEAYKVNR